MTRRRKRRTSASAVAGHLHFRAASLGTTFLHQPPGRGSRQSRAALAADPSLSAPEFGAQPRPPATASWLGSSPIRSLAPDFRRMHPIKRGSPQECSEITAHRFAACASTDYRIPSYRCWLDETGPLEAYRFHKRFLQHLQTRRAAAGDGCSNVPTTSLPLPHPAVYPDARLVFVHRTRSRFSYRWRA